MRNIKYPLCFLTDLLAEAMQSAGLPTGSPPSSPNSQNIDQEEHLPPAEVRIVQPSARNSSQSVPNQAAEHNEWPGGHHPQDYKP